MRKTVCFTFRSVTAAQSGNRALRLAGIDNQLSRSPKQLQQQGCGYCLRINGKGLNAALEVLRFEGVHYNKIYDQDSTGMWEEIRHDLL